MKIYFFLSKNENCATTYGGRLFATALKSLGYNAEVIQDTEKKFNILKNPDCGAIFFQKTIQCPAHTSQYIKALKGKVHLIHIDNDHLDMQSIEHIETLKTSDLVLVCTAKHHEALKKIINTPVEIVSNLLDFDNYPYVPIEKKKNNPLIISWQQADADAYTKDLLTIAKPLSNLYRKYGIDLHLYGWHMGKDYPDHSQEIRTIWPFAKFIEYRPLELYFKEIVPKIGNSDIFVMPYINHADRWGKSAFGLKRIMLLGVPIVALATEHHRTLIQNGFNGFLASTEEEWYEALEKLIVNPELRKNFSLRSRQLLESEYNNHTTMQKFMNAVNKHMPLF